VHRASVDGFGLRCWLHFFLVFCDGRRYKKLLPPTVTTKVKRFSITFGMRCGHFINHHAADGVFGHIKSVSCGWFRGAITASVSFQA
jgi:hypothetical protein